MIHDEFYKMTAAERANYWALCLQADQLISKRVFIPKGTRLQYCTDSPSCPAPEQAGRGYDVRVDHAVGPCVRWAGTGGYWRGAHVVDVELMPE